MRKPHESGESSTHGPSIAIPNLWDELRALVRQIPAGRVSTYGALATALGDVSAARWAAQALSSARFSTGVPSHRVVLRNGAPAGGNQSRTIDQLARLSAEGVRSSQGCVDLNQFGFTEFHGSQPLRKLQVLQAVTAQKAAFDAWSRWPDVVAAVDVSYGRRETSGPQPAVAAYVLYDVSSGSLVWSRTLRGEALFPYIPGYLAFRELPLLLELLDEVRRSDRMAPVVLVDGNGWLHPRHAGIATQLGVLAQCATIGVGKSLLCGRMETISEDPGSRAAVMFEGSVVATAIRPRTGGSPFFVSSGFGIDLESATQIVWTTSQEHRLPEPIWLAHTLCTSAAKSQGFSDDLANQSQSPKN